MTDKYLPERTRLPEEACFGPIGPPSSADLVDQVVHRLNALSKAATLEFSLAVGELVIRSLYTGDIVGFRQRKPKQHAALRRVARHPHLAMSASILYGCVAMYELCERLGIRSWKHVSTSHLRLVLPLFPAEQERLLQEVEANRWPVRRLDEEVAALARNRPAPCKRGGRKRQSRLHRTIHALQAGVDAMTDLLHSDEYPEEESSPESTRAAIEAIGLAVETCTLLGNRLAGILPGSLATPPQTITETRTALASR